MRFLGRVAGSLAVPASIGSTQCPKPAPAWLRITPKPVETEMYIRYPRALESRRLCGHRSRIIHQPSSRTSTISPSPAITMKTFTTALALAALAAPLVAALPGSWGKDGPGETKLCPGIEVPKCCQTVLLDGLLNLNCYDRKYVPGIGWRDLLKCHRSCWHTHHGG